MYKKEFFKSLVFELGGRGGWCELGVIRIFILEKKIVEILLIRQENFGLAKEVLKHWVIISIEYKSRMMAFIMNIDDESRLQNMF